jgi:transcription antitermination factor NusB
MRRRTRGRELALQFLYQLDLRGDEALAGLGDFLDESDLHVEDDGAPAEAGPRDKEVLAFARRLVEGTHQSRAEIDAILSSVTRNWDLSRMAAVDRNILRMAIFELLHCHDVPPKVTINEAIELGKKYSTANSRAFINGILDRVRIDHVVVRKAASKDAAPRTAGGLEQGS